METKWVKAPMEFKGDQGVVQAAFSTFNVVDRDGDIVEPSTFKAGQSVAMVWSHDWKNPIGKGVVRVDAEKAVFDGQFFMDTFDGEQAFRKVKAMGDLQEWSWGFNITDSAMDVVDEQPIRRIKGAELFEVSPVLVGANRETQTLSVKDGCPTCGKAGADVGRTVAQTEAIGWVDIKEPEPPAESDGWIERALASVQGAHDAELERLEVDIT
jgi:HK97 family phage prohead protease